MNREYQYIRPILTSPGGGNRRVVQTCRPAPLYRLIWTVPVCDQGDKRGLPKQVGGRDVCDQGEALSRIKALKKRGNALEGPGKLRALQDRLSLSPLRPFAERSRRHLCESTEMARTLTDEIHALSESIDALSQTLTTANRAVLVKDLEGLLRKREVLLRDLISLYFPEFLVLSCGQVGEGGLTREQIQFQNEELGRLKKSCVSALLKAYNGAYARREEGKKVPLFELCQVLVLQATHGQGPHKMAPMERLKRLEKACRSFGSSSGYPSDRYLGHSQALDAWVLEKRYQWGYRRWASHHGGKPPNTSQKKEIKTWVEQRHALVLEQRALRAKKKKFLQETRLSFPLDSGKTGPSSKVLTPEKRARLWKDNDLLLRHMQRLQTDARAFEKTHLGGAPRSIHDFRKALYAIGFEKKELAAFLGSKGSYDLNSKILDALVSQGIRSSKKLKKSIKAFEHLRKRFLHQNLGKEILSDMAQDFGVFEEYKLPLDALLGAMASGDKLVFRGGKRLLVRTGKIPIDGGSDLFGLGAHARVDRGVVFEVELGSDGYKVLLRDGYGGYGGLDGIVGWGDQFRQGKFMGILGFEGGHERLNGVTLTFPQTKKGRLSLLSFMRTVSGEEDITPASLVAISDNAHMKERIGRGQASLTFLGNVGTENEGGTFGIGAKVEGRLLASGFVKTAVIESAKEVTIKKEAELVGKAEGLATLWAHLYHPQNTNYDLLGAGGGVLVSCKHKSKEVFFANGDLKNAEITRYTSCQSGAFGALSAVALPSLLTKIKENPELAERLKTEFLPKMNTKNHSIVVTYEISPKIKTQINDLLALARILRSQGSKTAAQALEARVQCLCLDEGSYAPKRIALTAIDFHRIEEEICNANYIIPDRFADTKREHHEIMYTLPVV